MELNEEQLKNVIVGPNKEVIKDIALENSELFRDKKINELVSEKEKLEKLKQSYMDADLENSSCKLK